MPTVAPNWFDAAARFGDMDFPHLPPCISPMFRMGGSLNVRTNGRWAQRTWIDFNTWHLMPGKCPVCCLVHSKPIMSGSRTVRINSFPAARLFDPVGPLCTAVMTGSINVRIGG